MNVKKLAESVSALSEYIRSPYKVMKMVMMMMMMIVRKAKRA